MTSPEQLSLTEAAAALSQRTLSPVELMESLLDQIDRLDPELHAFVTVADHAAEDAARAQREWESGSVRGPLHGIPFAAKDLFDTAGVRTTASSRHWAERVPDTDSTVVRMLKASGMPLIGKTATHEFAHGATTPQTRNPWDPARLPGGSSGGSAAALAARMVPAALGTDSGGSIRTPSALCGVVGIKPTFGRVSRNGVAPLSWSMDHAGPLARTVADVALLLEAISGYDPSDPASVQRPADEVRPGPASVRGLRIGIPSNYFGEGYVADSVRTAAEAAGIGLQSEGAHLVDIELPLADLYEATGFTLLSAEASAVHAQRIRRAPDLFTDDVRWSLEAGMAILATDYISALRTRTKIQLAWNELMSDVDLVLAPTVPGSAVSATAPVYSIGDSIIPAGFAYVRSALPANLTGLPALAVPFGQDEGGLPLSVQVIGRAFDERTVLEAGLVLEQLAPPLPLPDLVDGDRP